MTCESRTGGLKTLPVPVSTPGYRRGALSHRHRVHHEDPETGVQNMGTYRAALKATDRLGVRMAARAGRRRRLSALAANTAS